MRIVIIYGSETGNTKGGAEIVAKALQSAQHEVDLRDVKNITADVLQEPFDLFILGVSTWGAVEEEVQQDFVDFYDDLAAKDLNGLRMAVFGSGDKGYDKFAKAVDFVEARVKESGATLTAPGFKYNLEPDPVKADLEAWALQAASA